MQRHVKGKVLNKQWLFHATDFQSLMYPCFIFCRMLGIFPYKLNTSTFIASKPHCILSVVIVCVSCVLGLSSIYDNNITKKINFGGVTRYLQGISYYILSGFTVIITHVLSGPRMRLLQTILETSSKLPPELYEKMSRFIHVKDILGMIFRFVQIGIIFSKIQEIEVNCMTILNVVLAIYFSLLVLQINMLYINCVCVLKACFKRINDNLAHIKQLINNMQPPTSSLIYLMQRNQFLLMELKTLKKQHLMVSNTVQMLNIIFSLQLLATVVMSYSITTFELYFYIVRWKDGVFFSLDKQSLDLFLTSMAYNILKITLLVWACETGKNQAQEIGTTIHDLLNSTNDEQIKNELQSFSLQILHHKNIFWAKGLPVDATLLTTIVGNITTYLLILIQFLNMSHSCDGDSN